MFTMRRIWVSLAAAGLLLATLTAHAEERFQAKLTGAAQLPEPTLSKAEGTFVAVTSDDGKKISYTLSVTNLDNANTAELHLGSPVMNGPVVVKLFPRHGAAPKKGAFNGVLVEGTIVAGDLQGSMQGSPLSDLIDQMREGSAYVNVHTNDGSESSKPGPGNYRLGEIRGQITKQ